MQNFHCQFGKNQAFDPYGKRFALEARLVFQNRQETLPDDLRSRAEKVSEHEITSDKMREAVIVQVRSLCMGAIRESRKDIKTNPNGTQNVNIYDNAYTLNNKALLELDAKNLPSNGEFIKSKMWADIVKALPGIDQAEGAIINLMGLYKVTPSPDLNLIPKDTMWMQILKEGLEEKDRASLQELEDLWDDTKDTARDHIDELKTEIEGGTRKAAEVHADEQVATAIESGKITTEQIEKLSKLSKKYSVEETRFDKWNDNDPDSKKRKLEESNIHSLLSVEDIKATKFIIEYTEGLIGKPAVFEVTQEEIEMYKKTVEFAGKKSGFNQQEILNLQNKMTEHNFGLLETPAYIEHIKAIVSSLPNIRSFAAASHVYQTILKDIEEKKFTDSQAFFREFYNRDGSLRKKSSQGIGKYISELGLKDALTKREYYNVFIICAPALEIQYNEWIDREEREEEIASREEKTEEGLTAEETPGGTETDERIETESPEERRARERKEEEDRRLEEDRLRIEEARRAREEAERMERETADTALREKKEKVAPVRTAIESYLETVDPSSTEFEGLRNWSDLQGDITDELIEEVGQTDTFRELKNEYIRKTVRIFARDLQALDKTGLIKKIRDERIFVESKAQVVSGPFGTQTIPAKSIYRPEIVFRACLTQIGLSDEKTHYAQDIELQNTLLSPITNLFAIFKTEDENEDIAPEAITDAMFRQFKSGGVAVATRETTAESAGEAEVAVEEVPEEIDLMTDSVWMQKTAEANAFIQQNLSHKAAPKILTALKYAEGKYNLRAQSVELPEPYIKWTLDLTALLWGNLQIPMETEATEDEKARDMRIIEKIDLITGYLQLLETRKENLGIHASTLQEQSRDFKRYKKIKVTGIARKTPLQLAEMTRDPVIQSLLAIQAEEINADLPRKQQDAKTEEIYIKKDVYKIGEISWGIRDGKLFIGDKEFALEEEKTYKITRGNESHTISIKEIKDERRDDQTFTLITYELDGAEQIKQAQLLKNQQLFAGISFTIDDKTQSIDMAKIHEDLARLGEVKIEEIKAAPAITETQPKKLFENDRTYRTKKQQADAKFALFRLNENHSVTVPADSALSAIKDLRKHIETLSTKGFELTGGNNDTLAETLRQQAEIEHYLGDFDNARKTVKEALGRNASNPSAITLLAEEIQKPIKVKVKRGSHALSLADTFDSSIKEGAIMRRMQARVNEDKTEYAYLPAKKYKVGKIELKLTEDGIMVNDELHRITTSQILIERDGELTKDPSSIILQIDEVKMEGDKIVSAEIVVFSKDERVGISFTYEAGEDIDGTYNGVDLTISGDSGIGSLRQIGSPLVFNSEEDGALDLMELEKNVGKIVIEDSGDPVTVTREEAVAVAEEAEIVPPTTEEPAIEPVTEEEASPVAVEESEQVRKQALMVKFNVEARGYLRNGNLSEAERVADEIEKEYKDMLQGELALLYGRLHFEIAVKKQVKISLTYGIKFEEFTDEYDSVNAHFDKAEIYAGKGGDAEYQDPIIDTLPVTKENLMQNIRHERTGIITVEISGLNRYEIMYTHGGTGIGNREKRVKEAIDDLNINKKGILRKRGQGRGDQRSLRVYLLTGDKINGVEVTADTTTLALADIERDRLAAVAVEEQRAAEEAARITEAARREEERVAEEQRLAEIEAARLAEEEARRLAETETATEETETPTTATEEIAPIETQVEESDEESEEMAKTKRLAKFLKKELEKIDTLPEIAELLYSMNGKRKDRQIESNKIIFDKVAENAGIQRQESSKVFALYPKGNPDHFPLAAETVAEASRITEDINGRLSDSRKSLAISIVKRLIEDIGKDEWKNLDGTENNEWWKFRVYIHMIGTNEFRLKAYKGELPFEQSDWEEIHAWFKEKTSSGADSLAEESLDPVEVAQKALLAKLPKLEGEKIVPEPDRLDIAYIFKGRKKLGSDLDSIITHYYGEVVDYNHEETPERFRNIYEIKRILLKIAVYGQTILRNEDTLASTTRLWERIKDIDDTEKYSDTESFTSDPSLTVEERRLLSAEFEKVRGFDEEGFATEVKRWVKVIITDQDIDDALKVTGENANKQLAAIPVDVDAIAIKLIKEQIIEGIAIIPDLLVANIENMRTRLLDDQHFRETVFTKVDREEEGSSLETKYDKLKESLQKEEARLVLDETFKEYRSSYPLPGTNAEDFRSATIGRLASRGITPTEGNSSAELWDTAIAKAHAELTDPAIGNLQTSLGTEPKMEKAVKDALEEISPIPDTQSFDEFLSKIAESNEDAQKFLAYYNDPEKSTESVSSKTYESLSSIYNKVWESARDEMIAERETSEGAEKERELAAMLKRLPEQAAVESEKLIKANPEISKIDLLEKVKSALQKAIPSRDKFKAEKDALIAEQIAKTDSKTYTAIIEKAFETKIAYLTGAEKKSEVDAMLKTKADFNQILETYRLTELVSREKVDGEPVNHDQLRKNYETLAVRFIKVAIDGMLGGITAFEISPTNNERRKDWVKNNQYDVKAFLPYYFEIMKTEEYAAKLLTEKEITASADRQLKADEYVKTALLFDVAVSDDMAAKVKKADTDLIGKWIYPDRAESLGENPTATQLQNILAPDRYLRYVRAEVFKDERLLFHDMSDRDKEWKAVTEFLFANIDPTKLTDTAKEASKYELLVAIEELETATRGILATNIFMDAATLEQKLKKKFEEDPTRGKQRIAISSTEGGTSEARGRFRELALVAFEEKFAHLRKDDDTKNAFTFDTNLRESWINIYQKYKLETFSPKSFEIYKQTEGRKHIDMANPLDKALGKLMTDAVMHYADIYLKEALQDVTLPGVQFREAFAKIVSPTSSSPTASFAPCVYSEKEFFRAISEAKIPDGTGKVHESIDYITHFLENFAAFGFEAKVAQAIKPEVKALDTAYVYSADMATVMEWQSENPRSSQPAKDFVKWIGEKSGQQMPEKIDKKVLEAIKQRLDSTLNEEFLPPEVASILRPENEWQDEPVPDNRFEEIILTRVTQIVRKYIQDNHEAPHLAGPNGLLGILKRPENFPKNETRRNLEQFFKVIDTAMQVIMEEAKKDETVSSWEELINKYKLTEYIPELGRMDRVRDFANDWVKPLPDGSENPNLKKTFTEFASDMRNTEPSLRNRDIYAYSTLVIETAVNKIILPAIKAAQTAAIEKAEKIRSRQAREIALTAANESYHPETFEESGANYISDVSGKFYKEIVDSNLAGEVAARGALGAAQSLEQDTSEGITLAIDSELRRSYFDFGNQKYDAKEFFAHFVEKESDIPEELRRDGTNFSLPEDKKTTIQTALDDKKEMIFIDSAVRIARKDKPELGGEPGPLYTNITDPNTTFRLWLDDDNQVVADKFLDWLVTDENNLATAEIIKVELTPETKTALQTIIEENWEEELDEVITPIERQKREVERQKQEVERASHDTKKVKEWAYSEDTQKIAPLNEFTKEDFLPRTSGEKLSREGRQLVESFITHVSGDDKFKRNFSDANKVELGTFLRAIDYRNHITANDEGFLQRKDRVKKALIKQGLEACSRIDEQWGDAEIPGAEEETVPLTANDTLEKTKLEIQLRIISDDREREEPHALLGVLKEITGPGELAIEDQRNFYFKELVSGIINPPEGTETNLTEGALTRFYKGNPENPQIVYFTSSAIEDPESNNVFQRLKEEVGKITDTDIETIAKNELQTLKALMRKSGKTSDEVRSMHTLKDNIESLQYIDATIDRITESTRKEAYKTEIMAKLNAAEPATLAKRIASTEIAVPDFDQLLTLLETTWGYEGKLRTSEDVLALEEEEFEKEFRRQKEGGERTLSNAEQIALFSTTLKNIFNTSDIPKTITDLIKDFEEGEKDTIEQLIYVYILQHAIDRLTPEQITEMKNPPDGSFLKYLEHIKTLTNINDETLKKTIRLSITDRDLMEQYGRIFPDEPFKEIDTLYDEFYEKPGIPVDLTSDRRYREWLDATPEIMESNEFMTELDLFIRNGVALETEDAGLNPVIDHYKQMKKYESIFGENEYSLEISGELEELMGNELMMEGTEKQTYDALTEDPEKFAYLLNIYKDNVLEKVDELREKQIGALESLRTKRETVKRPYPGTMLERAHLDKDKKDAYEITELKPEALAAPLRQEQLKYILQLYHNARLNDLPTKDELAEEESLYEKAKEIHNFMEKFTLEDIRKAITEQGLKLHMKWSMIEVNGRPLRNIDPTSPFLTDAVLLYMDGNKGEEISVTKRNGFFYRYLRETYKPKKDRAALLALTPDKLADDLVNACEIYREHLDNHYNVAERLKEYQEEVLGEESVTATLEKIEEEKLRERQAELHEKAADITNEEQRGIAERLAASPDIDAAETLIEGILGAQESESPSSDAGEETQSAPERIHESIERTADAEVKGMFEKIDTFIKNEIAEEDENAPLIRAAKAVIGDLLINAERENRIANPLSESKLGQVLDTKNLRIAAHLVDAIEKGNFDEIPEEVFDQMLMSLLERDDALREISARDRANLEPLREAWLSAREKEPQEITTELLREMLKKLPSTEAGIEQIPQEVMRQWYEVKDGELVFKEETDAYKQMELILQSFGFRVMANDLETAERDNILEPFIAEIIDVSLVPILNFYHPKDEEGNRNFTLQEPYKPTLLGIEPVEPHVFEDAGSDEKFIALKIKFFEAINGVKDKKGKASTLPHYQEVLRYLASTDATDTTNPDHPMSRLFYEVLLTMNQPEVTRKAAKKEMTVREKAVDIERTKLAEEVALQGSMLERMYREEVLADARLTIDKADGTYLKDSKVDFSNLQHLSRNVFSEKFRYHVKGGEFLTNEEAQTAYGTALDLLESSRTARADTVGFGDFALHKFYKNTPGIDFPIQAKEKFFRDYKDIKDALKYLSNPDYINDEVDGGGFQDGYENETWYKKEYKPLAKRVARVLQEQMVRDGVLEKRERRTLKYLEEKLLRGEVPASLMMMETEMESYMVSSSKILKVLEDINEEIGVDNILEGSAKNMDIARLHEITGYAKLRPELKTGLPPKVSIEKYLERLHLLQTQRDMYEWYSKADEETQRNMYEWHLDEETGEIHEKGFEKWKTESYGKTVKETLKWFGQALPETTAEGLPEFLQDILSTYEAGRPEILLAAHKDWSKEEIRQARRFDALHEDIVASTELGKPETYTDKRFGGLFEQAQANEDLQFTDIKKASGPYSEHDIAFNYGLTAENSHLQSIDAIYVSKRMRDDFVDALKNLDIRPPAKKRKMIDTFKNNPDDIAKLFYAVLGKEKTRKTEGFWKPHFTADGAAWAVMDIPKEEIDDFVKENEEIIKDLKWEPPTLRQVIEAKGTPGFAEFFERGITLEHLVLDQSETAMQRLKESENPLDDLMEYTLRIHEIGSRGKAIDRPNRAELEEEAKEHYTDLYELYANRDSAWEQYESRTFVMREDPEEKEKAETKLKTEMADTLLRDGITTLSFMYEYPVTWGKKYDKFVDVDTLHNLHEALNILLNREDESIDEEESTLEKLMKIRDEKGEIFSKKNLERIKKLSPRHIEAIATTLQFGKIYAKAIEQGIARKEMVFSIFENGKDGGLSIAALLRAQDIAFKANGVDLTADELYKIGDDLRTRLDNNTIEPIELSRDMEEAAKEYMDFRTLLAFPAEGYEGIDDEEFMAWKIRVITKAKQAYTERVQKLVAPFIDGKLTPDTLETILFEYTEIQRIKSEMDTLAGAYGEYEYAMGRLDVINARPARGPGLRKYEEKLKIELEKIKEERFESWKRYKEKETEIKTRAERVSTETEIDGAVEKLEKLLVNDYGELLHKSVTDLPETDATDFFAGFGMNVDVSAQRAVLGWNAGLNLPKGHQIDLLAVVTPGQGAGVKVGGSKEWSNLGPDERGKVHVFAHGGASVGASGGSLNLSGGIEYSRVIGGKEESRGTIGAFASAEIGPDGPKATVGVMASIGQLTPEEKEAKYAGELEAAREGILKREHARIDDYVETVHAGKPSKVRQDLKDAIKKAMEDVFLRAARDAEAGRAAVPKNIEFTKFEVGIAVGLDADIKNLGLPVKLHMAAVFSVDGKVFVTRIVTPEHIMDEASDKEIMRILEADGITAGEMTLTAPLASDTYNMMSSEIAREMIDRSETAADTLLLAGEGGEKIYTPDGKQGIALKRSYERSVAMGDLKDAKDALKKDFTKYMEIFKEKSAGAQIDWIDTGDLHKKRMRIFNTPGVTEIHIDPAAEELVDIDSDGNMIFDFASGFPIITKEVFEFESQNYGANTVNIITIKFNRHFTRKEIEASEKNYYVMLRNNEDVESKVVKMKPRRAVMRDLTMVERAKPKGPDEFFKEVEALYARARLIDEGHRKFIERFGDTEAVDPKYEYISEDEVTFIQKAVSAFIPKEQSTRSGEMERRELIEKYFTLSIGMPLDEAAGYSRLEPGDQLDLTATQTEETEKLILLIQDWFKGYAKQQGWPDTKLNNEQLQYFLGQMVFETFFNIHTGDYEGKTYFIDDSAIFSDAGTDTNPGKREKLRSKSMRSLDSNPVYKTMQNYMAHLHGSGKAMAKNIAVNYVNNHFPRLVGAGKDAKIDSLTESIIGDSTNAVYELISEKMDIDFAKAKEYCDYLAYHYFEKNGSPDAISQAGLSHFSAREQEMKGFFGKTETVRAFYETYESIFEGNNIQPRDMDALLLSRLNASDVLARHYKHNQNPKWYIAGGRAVEAISTNFGGLRKTFKYEIGDEGTPEEIEKARAVFEYMRPLPKLGKDGSEYDPLTDKEFFEVGGKDIKYEVEIEEAQATSSDRTRTSRKTDLESAIARSKERYDDLDITYEDVKEYLSTPLGLKVLEWAGVFLKEEQAEIMFKLFEEVRGQTYDELNKEALLENDKKAAFVEFVNINRILREIEYFETNHEAGKEAFYTVGLGGETYEAQIRYIPVENIDNGIRELTDAFTAIENNENFDANIEHFLKGFAKMKDDEFTQVTDAANFRTNTITYLRANEKVTGFTNQEVDELFRGLTKKEDVLRQLARILALAKFTPLSKEERITWSGKSIQEISELITQENEKEYLNQVNSRTMPDGTVKDVIPVAYIFKSSDPDNVMMVNVGGISATGTFLKCGNWSTLAQEQLTLFVQEQRQTVLEGGGAAMTRTGDVMKPEIDTEYTRISTGIAGSGRVKATPAPIIPEDNSKEDDNGIGTGEDEGPPPAEGGSTTGTDDPNRGAEGEGTEGNFDQAPKGTFTVTPESAGATTGTMLGTENPEGFSIRRDGEPEPDKNKKTTKPKRKKKDTGTPEPEDLDTL